MFYEKQFTSFCGVIAVTGATARYDDRLRQKGQQLENQ